ncbi:transporter [Halomontanus rarus]|uniref:transporter n=1 Tax=Halomontanus rarus TaxID=3034020 RepID=UPI001F61FF66
MTPPSSPAPPPPESPSEPSLVDRLGPDRLVLVVALVAFHGLVRIAERYLPEYLRAIGYGPIVVGLLASIGLAVAVGVRLVDASEPASSRRGRHYRALFAALLGTLGLLAWAGAPTLDALLGTPLTAIGWLLVGVVLLGLWHGWGPDELGALDDGGSTRSGSAGDIVTTATSSTALESSPSETDDEHAHGRSSGTRDRRTRTWTWIRTRTVTAALGLAGGAVLATAAFSGAETVRAGFALLVAAGSAVGLVAAVAFGLVVTVSGTTASSPDENGDANGDGGGPQPPPPAFPALEDVREAADTLPSATRWTILGDALVRLATAMTLPFVVLIVVEYHAVSLSIGPVSLPPTAVFAPLVLAEAVGAAAGALAAPTLGTRVDRRWLLAGGLVVPAVFPLALVAAPSSAAVLAGLFAAVGCRTALESTRPTGGAMTHAVAGAGVRARTAIPETLRTAIRVALVPAPLVGGVLYAIGPVAAFSLATTVGLLGVRELLRPLRDSS